MSCGVGGAGWAVRAAFITAAPWLISTVALSQDTSELPDVVDRVSASAVSISIETDKSAASVATGQNQKPESAKVKIIRGSGMVLTADGHVITAAHILDKARKITVVFRDGSQSTAQIVGKDALTGVALLKVTPTSSVTPARFANSDQVKAGQPVFSVGDPYGLRGTISSGIISAVGRDANSVAYPLLQTDITIYPGIPGAPLFNLKGEVVGMASNAYAQGGRATAIGLAVPSNTVKDIAEKLQRIGVVTRGFLGLRIRKPTEQEASSFGFKAGTGLIIVNVVEGGPTASSGLASGDAIATLNDRPIASPGTFVRTIFGFAPNTEVTLGTVTKQGHADVRVKVGRVAEPPVASVAAPVADNASDSATGCSRFLPSAGMTVSVPCDE